MSREEAVNLGRQILLTATRCAGVAGAYLRHADRLLGSPLAPPLAQDLAVEALHRQLRAGGEARVSSPQFGMHRVDPEANVALVCVYDGTSEVPEHSLKLLDQLAPMARPLARDDLGFESRTGDGATEAGEGPAPSGAAWSPWARFPFGGIVHFDRDLRVLAVEGREQARLGLGRGVGSPARDVFSAEAWSSLAPAWTGALEGRETSLQVLIGDVPWLAWVHPSRDSGGRVEGGLCVLQNHAAHTHLEDRAQQLEELLERTQRNARVGLFQLDVAGGTVQWAAPAAELHGRASAPTSVTWAELTELLHPEDAQALEAALERGRRGAGAVSVRYRLRSGRSIHADADLVYAGRTRWVGTVRDVTAEVQRDEDRARHQASLEAAAERARAGERAKSEFLTAVSHELRTPLNGIMGALSLLEGETMSAEGEKLIGLVSTSSQSLLSTIDDILDFVSADEGPEPVKGELRVDEILSRLHELHADAAADKGLELRVHLGAVPSALRLGDERRVRRALRSLLANAIKFTEQGEVCLGAEAEEDEVRFTIRDTGVGIAPELQKTLFEAFRSVGGGYGAASRASASASPSRTGT